MTHWLFQKSLWMITLRDFYKINDLLFSGIDHFEHYGSQI
jgi:hypothetical protein